VKKVAGLKVRARFLHGKEEKGGGGKKRSVPFFLFLMEKKRKRERRLSPRFPMRTKGNGLGKTGLGMKGRKEKGKRVAPLQSLSSETKRRKEKAFRPLVFGRGGRC